MFAVKRKRQEHNNGSNYASSTPNLSASKKEELSKKIGSKPTTIEIRGIPVHFPFTPYPCQTEYMTKVIDALNQSQNALLESPTGTGKTLCLLCAALAWQREQARFLPQNNPTSSLSQTQDGEKTQISNSSFSQNTMDHNDNMKARVPTILYASRTHSQISQVVRELRSTRYRPKHAVLASREQMCVHERVSKLGNAMQLNHECSKLTKERKCRHRLHVESFTPPSNDQSDPSITQPVLDMEDLLSMGTRHKVCPFYFTRNQISAADLIFLPYNYLFDRDARKSLGAGIGGGSAGGRNGNSGDNNSSSSVQIQGGINWKNAIVIFDEAHNLESFASESASFDLTGLCVAGCIGEVDRALGMIKMSPEMAENQKMEANMIKLKSIFLQMEEYLDKKIPSRGGSYKGDYIFEIWREGAQITFQNHILFINFVKQVSDLYMEIRGAAGTPKLDHFVSCIRRTFAGTSEAQCIAKSRAYRVHATASKGASSNTPGQFEYRTLSYWCFAPALSMHELAGLGPLRSMLVTSGTLSPLPSYSLELGLPFPIQLENPHIVKPNQVHVRVIGNGVSNKVLKSTYERRSEPEYITELGNTLASLARVIPGGMLVFFPSYGVMEQCVEGWGGPVRRSHNFSARNRKKDFFQAKSSSNRFSFPCAPNYYSSSTSSTPWKRLLSQKAIVLEPKSSADLKPAIAEFDKFLASDGSKGCLLMGVCRGKISEGIDFADHRARAVIITGLPFAPFHDPKVKLKREFLDGAKIEKQFKPTGVGGFTDKDTNSGKKFSDDESTISGAEWYSQQAHRAVNQAVGRVIRHRFDYGAVLLLDSRFGEPRNQNGLSKWVRPFILPNDGFGKAISTLAQFYRVAEKDPALSFGGKKLKGTREIKYEEDDQEIDGMANMEETEMIAVIQAEPQKIKSNEADKEQYNENNDGSTTSYVRPERIIKRFNIQNAKRHKENADTLNDIMSTVSDAKQQTISGQKPAKLSGISAIYSKRNQGKNKFSSAAISASSNQDMTTTIKSAWAGLDRTIVNSTFNMPKLSSHESNNGDVRSNPYTRKEYNKDEEKNGEKLRAKFFFQAASSHLSSEDFSSLRTLLVKMKTAYDKKEQRLYLGFAGKIVRILIKYENVHVEDVTGKESVGLLKFLYPLLPKQYQSAVRRIANDIVATKKAKNMKIAEKNRLGEAGLDKVITQRNILNDSLEESQKIAREKNQLDGDPNLEALRQEKSAALIRAEEINDAVRNDIKKIQLKMKPLDKSNRGPLSSVRAPVLKKKISNTMSSKSNVSFKSKAELYLTQEMDPVDRCLQEASIISNDITPKKPRSKSHLPKNLVCTICDAPPKKPHLAQCGHSACFSCWIAWLDKLGAGKGTCPVCRANTNKEDLARMVFEKKPGAGVPTLSQLYESEDDGGSESEEELEIIQKVNFTLNDENISSGDT